MPHLHRSVFLVVFFCGGGVFARYLPLPAEDAAEAPGLPWSMEPENEQDSPVSLERSPRRSSPREMLDAFRIDGSQREQFRDGRPLVSDEEETLVRILYRMPDFGLHRIQAWCQTPGPLEQLSAEIEQCRWRFFRLGGRVTGLEPRGIPEEAAERLEFDRFYIVSMEAEGSGYPLRILTRNVPVAWLRQSPLDERAGCCGLLLKRGGADRGRAALYFAAERVAWYPLRADASAGIAPSHVLLGEMGMDIGLLDTIRETNRAPLRPEDAEAFYQMLAAVQRADPEWLGRAATGGFELQPMLDRPERQQGRLINVHGTARRVQKVLVADPAIQARFGLDHYYQVDVFVPLGNAELRMRAGEGEEDVAIFNNSFPVNLCVPDLPPGLPVGEDLAVEIRAAGFYFKLWAYRTEFISALNPARRQVGPLLIAATPEVIPPREPAGAFWGILGGVVFLTLLGGILLWGWLYRRSDQRFQREVLRPRIIEPAKEQRS